MSSFTVLYHLGGLIQGEKVIEPVEMTLKLVSKPKACDLSLSKLPSKGKIIDDESIKLDIRPHSF